MEKYCIVFVTVDKKKAAEKITAAVLKPRLAACVNAVSGVSSSYWWKGKIEKAGEILLIMKTRDSLVSELIKKVKSVHPYDVPEIISVELKNGNSDYLRWIDNETGPRTKAESRKSKVESRKSKAER